MPTSVSEAVFACRLVSAHGRLHGSDAGAVDVRASLIAQTTDGAFRAIPATAARFDVAAVTSTTSSTQTVGQQDGHGLAEEVATSPSGAGELRPKGVSRSTRQGIRPQR